MKAYSWNMLFNNEEQERALRFIAESDFDMFCLQEVPQEFLDLLRSRFSHLAAAVETTRIFAGESSVQYVVILSRYPLLREIPLPIKAGERAEPGRTSAFTRVMSGLHLWARGGGVRNNLYIETDVPGHGAVSIYNLHLPLKYPSWRLKEFEQALENSGTVHPTLVCGDFNVLEKAHIAPLNWILGGRISDTILYRRERATLENRFAALELRNPLYGKSTHPLSRSQLDHILVSAPFSIKNAAVIRDRFGSDHHPICVELA